MFKSISWKLTLILAGVLSIGAGCLAVFVNESINAYQRPVKGVYTIATSLTSPAEIDRIIQASVNVSDNFTASRITKQLLATEIDSGGTTFRVYRFNFPQTCGQAGCLHVAVDQQDKVLIPLQLIDLPDRTVPFTNLEKIGCFSVKQPQNGAIEDYEICKPS